MSEEKRYPKGYQGRRHETIGSDILAVRQSLLAISNTSNGALKILGPVALERFARIEPEGWYPIEWLLEMMESIDRNLGRFGLIKMGRVLFQLSHERRVANTLTCARDLIYGIDDMYRHANRGQGIGGWKVLHFDDSRAELEKTTPHHCMMEEGILAQGLKLAGAPSMVSQSVCLREGAPCCHFVIEPCHAAAHWGSSS